MPVGFAKWHNCRRLCTAVAIWQVKAGSHYAYVSTVISHSAVMSDDDVMLAAALVVIVGAVERPKLPRRFWIRPSLKSRNRYCASDLINDLVLDDADVLNLEYRVDAGFRNCFRMTSTDFENLLKLISPQIAKKNTTFRQAIPPHERLAITLRFLATGDSYHTIMYMFKISKQVISRTVPEVCEALITALKDYIKVNIKSI